RVAVDPGVGPPVPQILRRPGMDGENVRALSPEDMRCESRIWLFVNALETSVHRGVDQKKRRIPQRPLQQGIGTVARDEVMGQNLLLMDQLLAQRRLAKINVVYGTQLGFRTMLNVQLLVVVVHHERQSQLADFLGLAGNVANL